MQGFSSDFEQFFWSKTAVFVYFKEQIWLPNRKCYGKNNLYFYQEETGNAMKKTILILSQ